MFWGEILVKVSKSSGQSIHEIKQMWTKDFFIMILNLEKKDG